MKMSAEQAYKILAVPQSADIKAIKKKYRKLMLKVHPDSLKSGKNTYQYSAQEINEAYSIIISIIPAMIIIHQSTHIMKNIIRTIIHMLPMAVIGMHLLMIMCIQAGQL